MTYREISFKPKRGVGDIATRVVIFSMAIGGLLFMLFGPPLPSMADDLRELGSIFQQQ